MAVRKGRGPTSPIGAAPREDVVLGGRYRLLSLLGEGGVAAVWRARDMRTGVLRAVKVLPPSSSGSPLRVQRLLREGRVMMRLRHPHIVRVYDVGESPIGPWYAMELIPGGTIEDVVRRDGRLRPAVAVRWILQTLEGLAAAHAVGVVHRDIKPSNLLVDENDQVVIADFGIALVGDSDTRETRTGAMLGSMLFMAPEQRLDARNVGSAADLHAVGATLFYAVTGSTPVDLFLTPPDSPRWDAVPASLRSVVQRAVALDPERRFPTAEAMVAALQEAALFLSQTEDPALLRAPVVRDAPSVSGTITATVAGGTNVPAPVGPTVGVVARDPGVRSTVRGWVEAAGYAGVELDDPRLEAPDLVVVDLPSEGPAGLDTVARLQRLPGPPKVVVLTAAGDVGSVVRATRAGAVDALAHPLDRAGLLACLAVLAPAPRPAPAPVAPVGVPQLPPVARFGPMSSVSPRMATLFRALERLAVGSTPVLVVGPVGSGRSVAARAVHFEGPRRGAPLVAVSAQRVTARTSDEVGALAEAWRSAEGGTLVVDDLELLGEGAVRWLAGRLDLTPHVGEDETELDDRVRVVATSSVEPTELGMGEDGAALARRFARGTVTLPPLVEREGDLEHLTSLLLRSSAARLGRGTPVLDGAARAAWMAYGWPRNLRELEDAAARVVAVAGDVVALADLPADVRGTPPRPVRGPGP